MPLSKRGPPESPYIRRKRQQKWERSCIRRCLYSGRVHFEVLYESLQWTYITGVLSSFCSTEHVVGELCSIVVTAATEPSLHDFDAELLQGVWSSSQVVQGAPPSRFHNIRLLGVRRTFTLECHWIHCIALSDWLIQLTKTTAYESNALLMKDVLFIYACTDWFSATWLDHSVYLEQGNIIIIVAYTEIRMVVDCSGFKGLFSVLSIRQWVSTQHNRNSRCPPATHRTFIILHR